MNLLLNPTDYELIQYIIIIIIIIINFKIFFLKQFFNIRIQMYTLLY